MYPISIMIHELKWFQTRPLFYFESMFWTSIEENKLHVNLQRVMYSSKLA
jgi:hypothetical protein